MDEKGSRVRKATKKDVPQLVALSGKKRREYAKYQPLYWREAADSDAKQRPFFEKLLENEYVIALVHEQDGVVDGFVTGALTGAPPIYDPGGPMLLIDEFCVADAALWESVGSLLLSSILHEGKNRKAVQSVVICGHQDEPKRKMLQAIGYDVLQEWWLRDIRSLGKE